MISNLEPKSIANILGTLPKQGNSNFVRVKQQLSPKLSDYSKDYKVVLF